MVEERPVDASREEAARSFGWQQSQSSPGRFGPQKRDYRVLTPILPHFGATVKRSGTRSTLEIWPSGQVSVQ